MYKFQFLCKVGLAIIFEIWGFRQWTLLHYPGVDEAVDQGVEKAAPVRDKAFYYLLLVHDAVEAEAAPFCLLDYALFLQCFQVP